MTYCEIGLLVTDLGLGIAVGYLLRRVSILEIWVFRHVQKLEHEELRRQGK